jgi:hypothetical protein
VAKKTTKPAGSDSKPARPKAKTETSAEEPKTAAAAEPAKPQAAKPKPVIPQRPVPPHQKFLDKGGKSQMSAKGRIFRHQGR